VRAVAPVRLATSERGSGGQRVQSPPSPSEHRHAPYTRPHCGLIGLLAHHPDPTLPGASDLPWLPANFHLSHGPGAARRAPECDPAGLAV
jgi:hypothetical protein